MRKTVITLIMIIVLAAVFSGCEAPVYDITGLWYEKTGLAGTLEFKDDGVVIMVLFDQTYTGTYEFDDINGKGEINFSDLDPGTNSFILSGGEINVENGTAIYARNKVGSKDIGNIIQGLDGSGN